MNGRREAMDLTRLWVAILAAYALVLQAVVPMAPAVAGIPGADVICRAGSPERSDGGTAPDRHAACIVHCVAIAAAAGTPDAVALPAPRLASVSNARTTRPAVVAAAARRGPAQPRAPPAQA
jgi:hypothetical protein